MNHDAQFHERRIDRSTAGVDDVDIVFTHGLRNTNVGFADTAAGDFGLGER